jgi:hypothetical protein
MPGGWLTTQLVITPNLFFYEPYRMKDTQCRKRQPGEGLALTGKKVYNAVDMLRKETGFWVLRKVGFVGFCSAGASASSLEHGWFERRPRRRRLFPM